MNWGMSEGLGSGMGEQWGCLAHFWNLSFLLLKNHTGILRPHYLFLDGHCDVDNYYTFWAPSNMFSVGINNRHIARTMTSLFPSHELHHHHHQHQHQLRPWLVTSPPFNPLRLPGSVGEKPLSCVWLGQKTGGLVPLVPLFAGILQILKVPSNVSQRRGGNLGSSG